MLFPACQSLGFRVEGFGFRALGLEFWVSGFDVFSLGFGFRGLGFFCSVLNPMLLAAVSTVSDVVVLFFAVV